MNIRVGFCCALIGFCGSLCADYVELKDGRRLDGIILAENPDGLEIEIGSNESGTIRRVLIIHASEIATWAADEEGRIASKPDKAVARLAGTDYVKRLLADAEAKIQNRKFDEGIEAFQEAAEVATQNLDELEDMDKVEALNMRAHALRLALAAMEGKASMVEAAKDNLDDSLDDRLERWEEAWRNLQDEKSDQEEALNTKGELGNRFSRAARNLEERENRLKRQKALLDQEKAMLGMREQQYEMLKVQTEAQIEMIKERIDQTEDEAKDAKRALRRR